MEIQVPSLLRIKPDALHKIGKYVKQEGFTRIALIWGEGVKELFATITTISLASAEVSVVFEATCTTNDINDAFEEGKKLPGTVELVVAIGGGKVIDFCKYVAFSRQIPLYSVPTLISNDAFASPTSSLTVDGARKSVKTAVPYGVIIDTAIIRAAPRHFLYSGIGDLFCKTTAVFDWKIAWKRNGEHLNDFAASVAQNAADTFSFYATKDPDDIVYIGIVARSLLMTGIAMIIAGNSRPASGSEHLISHAYDKVAKKPSLHGLQVGVASYAISYLQGSTHAQIRTDMITSGFYEYMAAHPLDREDFKKAVTLAPEIKEGFYTILSEKGNMSRILAFIDEDEWMSQMTV